MELPSFHIITRKDAMIVITKEDIDRVVESLADHSQCGTGCQQLAEAEAMFEAMKGSKVLAEDVRKDVAATILAIVLMGQEHTIKLLIAAELVKGIQIGYQIAISHSIAKIEVQADDRSEGE